MLNTYIRYILFIFFIAQQVNSDVIVFDDMYKDEYIDEIYTNHNTRTKTKKNIQKVKEIKKTQQQKEKKKPLKSKFTHMKIDELLNKYRELINNNTNNNEKKEIFEELKQRFTSSKFEQYDTIAILNALEDIEQQRVNKYEALLTIDTMIEEIK